MSTAISILLIALLVLLVKKRLQTPARRLAAAVFLLIGVLASQVYEKWQESRSGRDERLMKIQALQSKLPYAVSLAAELSRNKVVFVIRNPVFDPRSKSASNGQAGTSLSKLQVPFPPDIKLFDMELKGGEFSLSDCKPLEAHPGAAVVLDCAASADSEAIGHLLESGRVIVVSQQRLYPSFKPLLGKGVSAVITDIKNPPTASPAMASLRDLFLSRYTVETAKTNTRETP
ncbi:MAG: hypothetical protein RL095_631 [Verrucomicrobiota bacterium]|jgi:hypothetical protein